MSLHLVALCVTVTYVVPVATPVTTPSFTVAVPTVSDTNSQSFASTETLLYRPPRIPITERVAVPFPLIATSAGVTAISVIDTSASPSGTSVTYA